MRSEWLEAAECDGWRLRVEFNWHVDRYRHVISLIDAAGRSTPLLESIEGSPTDDWPASPPLQNLHCENQTDGSRVALLVGMAGRGHWSASIGSRPNESALVFDLACRSSAVAGPLDSTYRLASGVCIESAAAGLARLQIAGCTAELTASQVRATRCELVVVNDADLKIQPAGAAPARATPRWLYELAIKR